MIPLDRIIKEAEEKYFEAVVKIIGKSHKDTKNWCCENSKISILDRYIALLDEIFISTLNVTFKEFVLAPYEQLCKYKKILANKNITKKLKSSINMCNICKVSQSCLKQPSLKSIELDWAKIFTEKIYIKFSKKLNYLDRLLHQTKLNIWLAKQHDMMVCPYCNINYVFSRGDNIFGAQLDHFFDKDKHPIFAICLYNLIPSCSVCNLAKGTNESGISPFDQNVELDKIFSFACDIASADFPYTQESVSVQLKFIGNYGIRLKEDMSVMGIEDAYKCFNTHAQKVVLKSFIYNDAEINMLLNQYPQIFKSKQEVMSLVYNNDFWGENDINKIYKNNSLSRLTHDILVNLEVIC